MVAPAMAPKWGNLLQQEQPSDQVGVESLSVAHMIGDTNLQGVIQAHIASTASYSIVDISIPATFSEKHMSAIWNLGQIQNDWFEKFFLWWPYISDSLSGLEFHFLENDQSISISQHQVEAIVPQCELTPG